MDIQWEDVRVFLAAAEARSLSAAARELGVGQATVSRRVAQLEEQLGYPLFTRSVAGVTLNDAGAAMLVAAQTMRDGALAFDAAARGKADELSGRVRFTAAPGLAVDVLAPFATVIRKQHPQLRLEVLSSVGYLDLARGEADLAIRTREPTDPELRAVASGFAKISVYACKAYARALPCPAQLSDIDWVGWSASREGLAPENWLREQLPTLDPVFTADDFLVLEEAVAAGVGALLLPDVQAMFQRRLTRVTLTDGLEKKLPVVRVFLVAAKSTWRSPRVRATATAFLDWFNCFEGARLEPEPT